MLKYLREANPDPDEWAPELEDDEWAEVRRDIKEMNQAGMEDNPELLRERTKKDAWVSKILGSRAWIEKQKRK